ncbi:hypothetical protein GCM10010492_02190 [Saccharothrix mutabilis subsp. mutabilis]|uniref:Abortive infection protein n=1 Tax=Saccharothrix mutabilis subsp. mutabilis TaxID=66855 RepID=A0ABN0T0A8_9PSEU
MRGKGISYDTGFINKYGDTTHEPWDLDVVARDLRVIRDELHCTAVRLTGGHPERLEAAARSAAELGLEVWFSPFTGELTPEQVLAVLVDCAERAEGVRRRGAEVVFVTGAELSLFTTGFLPGADGHERTRWLLSAPRDQVGAALAAVPGRVNEFLARAVAVVRERFGGKVTYASIPFEGVDWTPFDFVAVDAYRSAEVADRYRESIRSLVAAGKPLAVTEFGSATFRGAGDLGARGGLVVRWDGPTPVGLDGPYERDEAEQARYLDEVLSLFEEVGVDTAFVYTFANHFLPHRDDLDLDMASYGVVKVCEDGTWRRKAAFEVVAAHYR